MTRAGAAMRLTAIEAGSGEPVVLLHGSASSSRFWRSLIEVLYDRYRVIAPDLVGYGATAPWSCSRKIAMADHDALLADLLDDVRVPVHLVGHGFGGALALRFAREHPDRVRSLSLVEPIALQALDDGHPHHRRLLAEVRSLARALRASLARGIPARAAESFVDFWSGEGAWQRLNADLREDLVRGARSIIADFDAIADEPPGLEGLGDLAVPTFVLAGARSRKATIRIAHLLAKAMPRAFCWSVEGAGHLLPLTHASEVNRLVAAQIDRHRDSSTVVRMVRTGARDQSGVRPGVLVGSAA